MSPAEEIARFNQGLLNWTQLSPAARDLVKKDWLLDRLGWEPDYIIRVSGVKAGGRQGILAKTKRLITNPRVKIPVRLHHEDNNPHDKAAIAVGIPTVQDGFGDFGAWERAGYIPRGHCPACGRTLTGPILDANDSCPSCKAPLFVKVAGVRTPLDPIVELNKFLLPFLKEGRLKVGLDNIMADPQNPTLGMGLSIGLKIERQ